MKRLILALLLAPITALAGTVTLSWTAPTTYSNGAPLPAADIVGYEIECVSFTPNGSTTAQTCAAGVKTIAPATSYVFDVGTVPVSGGTYAFVARTKVAAATSANSNTATKLFAAVPPNPPGGLVTTAATAYDVKWSQRERRFVLNKKVGEAPIGTTCNAGFQMSGGYAQIAPEAITFTRPTNSALFVAKCAQS